jgi:Leucine-rich repeat (LRR) protein
MRGTRKRLLRPSTKESCVITPYYSLSDLPDDVFVHLALPYDDVRAIWTAFPKRRFGLSVPGWVIVDKNNALRLYRQSFCEDGVGDIRHTIRTLNLSFREVSDLRPLSSLTSLQVLYLSRTRVIDLRPLSSLTSLRELNLSYTQVSDVRPLSSLTSLQRLYLGGTLVRDVRPLSGMTSLQILSLYTTGVSDVSSLSSLTSLRELNLAFTKVTDVSSLATLTSLQNMILIGIVGIPIFPHR